VANVKCIKTATTMRAACSKNLYIEKTETDPLPGYGGIRNRTSYNLNFHNKTNLGYCTCFVEEQKIRPLLVFRVHIS
jgi:hypothetical protein